MEHFDVAVIGGGIHGLFSAYALSRRGKSVVVCEQFEFGHLRGSSHGPSRIFRLSYKDPEYVRLALNSRALWQQVEDDAQVSLIEPNGCVVHGSAQSMANRVNAMDECAVVSEVLTRDEAKYRWPNLEFDESIVFQPGGGRIYARAASTALLERCKSRGVELKEFFPIKKIETTNQGTVLESDSGSVSADVVVCATGSWTPSFLDGIVNIPKPKISQEQTLYFNSYDLGAIWPNIVHHHGETTYYSQDAPGVGILVSGVRMGTYIESNEQRDFIVDPLVAINVCDHVEKYFPGLDPNPISSETSVATFNASGDFLIDRVGNIVVVMACEQKGFTFSPLVGKMVADLVDGSKFSNLKFRLP